jgi:hypothetical protein
MGDADIPLLIRNGGATITASHIRTTDNAIVHMRTACEYNAVLN